MTEQPLVGVTVLPEYIQSESIEGVLQNLVGRAKATAVATSPYLMAPADEQTGGREPPIDAGEGAVRLLERPLWGRRELWVATAPSFAPDVSLYRGLRYQPPPPSELTRRHERLIHDFLDAAHGRGLKVYFQVMAAIPPGYRVQFGGAEEDDKPRMFDGRIPARRVSNNASLASPHVVAYQEALIRDLLRAYPNIDGLRFDWPEYPPYLLDEAFFDFSDHARAAAERLRYDFEAMRRDAESLYCILHGELTDDALRRWLSSDAEREFLLMRLFADYRGVAALLHFKATLAEELVASFRRAMDEAGGRKKELSANAFPPPWSIVSGFDFARVSRHCASVAVKLYGMHWAMMLRLYGRQLLEANPNLSEPLLTRALVRLLDIADDEGLRNLDAYRYPSPDQPFPVGREPQLRKIRQAQAGAGATPVHTLVHAYGPLDDFGRRLALARQAGPHGFWVNRYGYLSDEKLDAIGG
ncbi:MAG: hypothetical protein KY475_01670 [Planctomycetes bacterium]|nr:hypothetical protein [Planctomycetota bacterium]